MTLCNGRFMGLPSLFREIRCWGFRMGAHTFILLHNEDTNLWEVSEERDGVRGTWKVKDLASRKEAEGVIDLRLKELNL